MTALLEVQGVGKTYPDGKQALQGIDLCLSPGVFGLLGPNGAGKSSLMRTLVGIQPPSSGVVRFAGEPIYPDSMALRRRCGSLPQECGIYPDLTGIEFLDHVARLRGFANAGTRRDMVQQHLAAVNLTQMGRVKVGNYSGGMRHRLGLAQALLGSPALLVVDEPTAGLDPEERLRMLALLQREARRGAVVVLSTHIVQDVEDVCESLAVLNDGRLLGTGVVHDFLQPLEGRVWVSAEDSGAAVRALAAVRVLSSRLVRGRETVRVLADVRPDVCFEESAPTLEDAYFALLKP